MKEPDDCASPSSIDQLHLPVDVVGHLLSVLSSSDIESTRLVCQSWKQAIDHQLTAISPLHLPQTSATAFDGCTALHAPILRCAGQSPAADTLAADTTAPVGGRLVQFAWQAPHVNIDDILGSFKNVNDLDLTGQELVYDNCLQQMAQHLTCLRSLKLDACKVTLGAVTQLTAFATAGRTGLTSLSMAGLTYGHEVEAPRARGQGQKSPKQPGAAPKAAAGAGPGAAVAGNTPGVTVNDMLGAIAAQPLVHLDFSTGVALDRELVASAGPLIRFPTKVAPKPVRVAGRCQLLAPLGSTLQGLKLLGTLLDPVDWQLICNSMTKLTELYMSWDMTAPIFASISQLQRLQSLRVTFQGNHHEATDPYTLAPLAQSLTSVHLSGSNSLSLLLSLTECTNMQQLQLQGVRGAAGAPDLMVQIMHSLPLLRELKLAAIQAPNLQRTTVNFLGDYLVQQLDCCCPHLTKLVLADAPFNGTGIRLAATSVPLASLRPATPAEAAAAAVPAASSSQGGGTNAASGLNLEQRRSGAAAGAAGDDAADDDVGDATTWDCCRPGQGGLRRLKHLELNASGLYCSALPHLSCLTGLESLTLWDLSPARFLHNCRYDCFRFVSALTNLKSFNIPAMSTRWMPAAAAAAAAVDGGDAAAAAVEPGAGQVQGPGVGELQGPLVGALGGMGLNQAVVEEGFDEFENSDEWEDEDEDWDSDEFESATDEYEGSSGDGEEAGAGEHDPAGGGQAVGLAMELPELQAMLHALGQMVHGMLHGHLGPAAAAALGFDGLEQAVAAQNQIMQQHMQQAMQIGGGLQQILDAAQAAAIGWGNAPIVLLGQPLPLLQPQLPPQLLPAPAANGPVDNPAAVIQLIAVLSYLVQHLEHMVLHLEQQQQHVQQQQQGAAGGGVPLMGAVPQQHVQGAAAAGVAAGAVGQAALQGALQRPTVEVMEPHLHFLCRLNSLVSLNIGCLVTKGPCVMHLSKLTNLQTLVLSGRITLTPASLQLLQKLRLPSVKHLSITDCSLDLGGSIEQQQQAQVMSPAAAGSSSSSRAGLSGSLVGPSSIAAGQGQGHWLYTMDGFVPVLSAAFPAVENLKLGCCDLLSIVGLAALLQQLPNLQRLWVHGMRDDGQLHIGKRPHNFVRTTAAAAVVSGGQLEQAGLQRARTVASDCVEALEHGYCVPYDPNPSTSRKYQQKARTQLPWELAWFLEHGVVVPVKSYDGAPISPTTAAAAAEGAAAAGVVAAAAAAGPAAGWAAAGVVAAGPAAGGAAEGVAAAAEEPPAAATAREARAAARAARAAAAPAAAAVPAGAVAVPCAVVSGLKYVSLVRNDNTAARVFTRYHGRLKQGVHYSIWNDL